MGSQDPRVAIDTLREKLESGERGGCEHAREALLGLSDNIELIPSEVGDYRHRDILRHGSRMSEETDVCLADALEERDVAEEIVRWIHRNYENEHTNQDYRRDLRAFGRYADEVTEDPPDSLDWIPTGTSNDFDPKPSERDLVTFDEAQEMIEHATNDRARAAIALQFEGGLRGGELIDLRVGDIFESEHALGVHPDGKTGEHPVHLIFATPWVNQWLTKHPGRDDDDAPLWSQMDDVQQISDNMFRKDLRRAAERGGVDKTVTPTVLRKSNTRYLLRLGMKRGKIEQRQGRVQGSDHTARYEAAFGDESLERTYASLHGKDVETDDSGLDVAPVPCPRCGKDTPRDTDFCIHCNQALDFEVKELVDDISAMLDEEAIEADDPDRRRKLVRARRTVEERPARMEREELHRLASSLSDDG